MLRVVREKLISRNLRHPIYSIFTIQFKSFLVFLFVSLAPSSPFLNHISCVFSPPTLLPAETPCIFVLENKRSNRRTREKETSGRQRWKRDEEKKRRNKKNEFASCCCSNLTRIVMVQFIPSFSRNDYGSPFRASFPLPRSIVFRIRLPPTAAFF